MRSFAQESFWDAYRLLPSHVKRQARLAHHASERRVTRDLEALRERGLIASSGHGAGGPIGALWGRNWRDFTPRH